MDIRRVVKGVFVTLIAVLVFSSLLYVVAAYSQQVGQMAQSSGKGTAQKISIESLKYLDEGKAYLQNGDYNAALRMFEKAFEVDPNNLSAYLSAADCCIHIGAFKKAKDYAEKSVELSSDSSYARFSLAVAQDNLEEYESAKNNYEKALSGCSTQKCSDDMLKVVEKRLKELK